MPSMTDGLVVTSIEVHEIKDLGFTEWRAYTSIWAVLPSGAPIPVFGRYSPSLPPPKIATTPNVRGRARTD